MESLKFDNVKAEKAAAMRRYNLKQKLKYLLQVSASLGLLFWSSKWIMVAVETGTEHLRELTLVIDNNPLLPFLLVNVLILLIFVLSSQKPAEKTDLYEEYAPRTATRGPRTTSSGGHISNTATCAPKVTSGPGGESLKNQESYQDKRIVCSSTLEKKDIKENPETAVCPVETDDADSEDCSSKEILEPERKIEKSSSVHERLSDVEFNVVVATYIKKQNWVWRREKSLHQRDYLALFQRR